MGEKRKHKKPKRPAVEKELRRQTKRFAPVLEISPMAIVITDLGNRVASWNPAAERLFGYTGEEAAGRDLDDLVAKTETLHAEAEEFRRRVAASEHVQGITRRTRKDGAHRRRRAPRRPDRRRGRPGGDLRDLPRHHGGRPSTPLLRGAARGEPRGDRDHRSRRHRHVLEPGGRAAVRLLGGGCRRPGHRRPGFPSPRPLCRGPGAQPNVDGIGDGPPRHPTDQERWLARRRRRRGRPGHHRRGARREARLLPRHQRAAGAETVLPVAARDQPGSAIVVTDLEAKVVSWNPGAEHIFGYMADEAIGIHLDDLVASRPDLHQEALGYSERAKRGERVQAPAERTRKDGVLVDVQMFSEPVVVSEERVGFVVIYHDVTEIQRQKLYYEALVQSSPVAIALLDPEATVTSWNPAAERLFGYPRRRGDREEHRRPGGDHRRGSGRKRRRRPSRAWVAASFDHSRGERGKTEPSSTWKCSALPSSCLASPRVCTRCITISASFRKPGVKRRQRRRPRARSSRR